LFRNGFELKIRFRLAFDIIHEIDGACAVGQFNFSEIFEVPLVLFVEALLAHKQEPCLGWEVSFVEFPLHFVKHLIIKARVDIALVLLKRLLYLRHELHLEGHDVLFGAKRLIVPLLFFSGALLSSVFQHNVNSFSICELLNDAASKNMKL
jgi:hypothetical protein